MLINDIKISGDKNILSGNLLFMCIPLNDEYPIRIYDDKTTKIIKGKAFIYNSKNENVIFQSENQSWRIEKGIIFYLCQIIGIY
ncbi:hypothetical protein AB6G16_12330 [Proteus mirabilis]